MIWKSTLHLTFYEVFLTDYQWHLIVFVAFVSIVFAALVDTITTTYITSLHKIFESSAMVFKCHFHKYMC